MERKPISKKIRFEIFKRDKFKCGYCGKTLETEGVVLHVDHIKPVKDGGSNDLENLITACGECNLGKGARTLSDDSVLQKSRKQLELQQERLEQLQLMMEWKEGLKGIEDKHIERLNQYWSNITKGYSLNNNGKTDLRRLLKKYSSEEIIHAFDESEKYLRFDKNDKCTKESVEVAWGKVGAICHVVRQQKRDPEKAELYKVRNYIRYRFEKKNSYFHSDKAIQWLDAARSWNVSIDELREIGNSCMNWRHFSELIDEVIEKYKKANMQSDAQDAKENDHITQQYAEMWERLFGAEELEGRLAHLAKGKEWLGTHYYSWLSEDEKQTLEDTIYTAAYEICTNSAKLNFRYQYIEDNGLDWDAEVETPNFSQEELGVSARILTTVTWYTFDRCYALFNLPIQNVLEIIKATMRVSAATEQSMSLDAFCQKISFSSLLFEGHHGPVSANIKDRELMILGMAFSLQEQKNSEQRDNQQ